MPECTCPKWPDWTKDEHHGPRCPYSVLAERQSLTRDISENTR